MLRTRFYLLLTACSIFLLSCEKQATEKVLARYPAEVKQVSVWVYPDGTIQKKVGWYFNGIMESVTPYKDGKPDGGYTRWTSHGDIAETGQFRNGFKEGEWKELFNDGRVAAVKHYVQNKKQGEWTGYYYDGTKAWVQHYRNDSATGTWLAYHTNGKLAEENSCKNGKGSLIRYSFDGKKEFRGECLNGRRNGTVEEYYPGGALATRSRYTDDTLDGKMESYLADGKITRAAFWKKGQRDSLWTWYDRRGRATRTGLFKNGSGTAYGEAESTFVDNLLNDTLRYFKKDSGVRCEEIWEKGEKTMTRSYYPDSLGGRIASEGAWKNGKLNGLWRNWFPTGTLRDSLFYRDGDAFGPQFSYDSTGKLFMRKDKAGKTSPLVIQLNTPGKKIR
jgi:antitoxin component YwqK of YwqJK toxin-antitoxin module